MKYAESPRPIRVSITTFRGGMAFNAVHYYVELREEDSPFIDCTCGDRPAHEHKPWDTVPGMNGEHTRFSLLTISECLRFISQLRRYLEGSPLWLLGDLDDPDFWHEEADKELDRELARDREAWRDEQQQERP